MVTALNYIYSENGPVENPHFLSKFLIEFSVFAVIQTLGSFSPSLVPLAC